MLTAEDVKTKLREIPFTPFRIVTSSGEGYDVTHPDSVLVTKRVLYVGVYRRVGATVPDQAASVSMLHVSALEPLTASGTLGGELQAS